VSPVANRYSAVSIYVVCMTYVGIPFNLRRHICRFTSKRVNLLQISGPLSALMLYFGWQEAHSACKNCVVRYCHGYLSGARCK